MKGAIVEPGTVSHGTLRLQDLIPSFMDLLNQIDPARYLRVLKEVDCNKEAACYQGGYVEGIDLVDNDDWWNSSDASILLDELFDFLDEYSPEGYRFGAHEGDGSDFGYWPVGDEGGES